MAQNVAISDTKEDTRDVKDRHTWRRLRVECAGDMAAVDGLRGHSCAACSSESVAGRTVPSLNSLASPYLMSATLSSAHAKSTFSRKAESSTCQCCQLMHNNVNAGQKCRAFLCKPASQLQTPCISLDNAYITGCC